MPHPNQVRSDVLASARKSARLSYPEEPDRVHAVQRGIELAFDSGYTVAPHHSMLHRGKYHWCVMLMAPVVSGRPSTEVAKRLKRLGFWRLTNHTWGYPLPTRAAA